MLTVEYLENKLNEISQIKKRQSKGTSSERDYLILMDRLEIAYQAEYAKALKRPRPIIMDDGEVIPYWSRYAKEYI